jgi:hypothetical protein
MEWYFLCLAINQGMKITIWAGENSSGQIMRDLITMYIGKNFKDISYNELRSAEAIIEYYFTFIDNSKLYKPKEILDLIEQTDCNIGFIDPFTGLDRGMTHSDNYEFLNNTRQFCNQTGKTIYISTHPTSESGRNGNLYPDQHHWKGHLKPPLKDHIEGGKAFLNRCDDMFVIHRLIKHETMKYFTMVGVEKIKDTDTGGKHTALDVPVLCYYNFGVGFTVDSKDPLKKLRPKQAPIFKQQKKLDIWDEINTKTI